MSANAHYATKPVHLPHDLFLILQLFPDSAAGLWRQSSAFAIQYPGQGYENRKCAGKWRAKESHSTNRGVQEAAQPDIAEPLKGRSRNDAIALAYPGYCRHFD